MHAEGWVTHESDMDLPCATIDLSAIGTTSAVVLSQARAIAESFTNAHWMEEPVRASRPAGAEALGRTSQYGSPDVVFGIPVAKPASEKHGEDGFDVGLDHLGSGAVVILAGVTQAGDATVAAGPAPVSPEIIIVLQVGDPVALVGQGGDGGRAKEGGEAAVPAGREGFAAADSKGIVQDGPTRRVDFFLAKFVVLVQVLAEQFEFA